MTISLVLVQAIFFKPDHLSNNGMELTCSCDQMKAENMQFFFPDRCFKTRDIGLQSQNIQCALISRYSLIIIILELKLCF